MALGDHRSGRITAGSALGCARGRHPRLGLAVRCGDLALSQKNIPFCAFFTCSQNTINGAIFVNIGGFRPCLSKPSYGAPQWALMVRRMQKERLKSPHESLFYVTRPVGSFWSFLVKHAILVILASHFRTRMGFPKKKCHLRSCLN